MLVSQQSTRPEVLETTSSTSRMIEVRLARPEDYLAVLDINRNVYQGTDYLPGQYHTLVNDPDFCYYVCVVDGEVAAFEGLCKLDDDNTIMLRSLRVKDTFQGQGISSHIRKKIYEDFKHFPGQKRLRQSCSEQSRFSRSKTFLSQNRLMGKERRVTFHEIDIRRMKTITTNDSTAKPISWEDFDHVLRKESVRKYLYPKDIMTQDFWFYDALPCNIKHLKKRCQRVFVTSDLEKLDVNKGFIGILSSYFAPEYLYMVVNVSGQAEEGKEKEQFKAIVEQCLAFVQHVYKEDESENRKLKFAMVCGQGVPEELIHEVARPFGFEPARPEDDVREQFYFEQGFEKMLPARL